MTVTDTAIDDRIKRLMQTRIEPPPRPIVPTLPHKPWHWGVFWYVHAFVLYATWRSVTSAIVRHAIRRPLAWSLEHGYLFATTVLSGRVGDEVYHTRMKICVECGKSAPRAGYLYCRVCCPIWVGARLEYKNRKAGQNCMLGLHPGSVAIRKGTANGD